MKDLIILSALFLPLSGLVFAVCADSYISRRHRGVMLGISAVAAALIGQNYVEYLLAAGVPNAPLRTAVAVFGYIIRPVILVLFMHIVTPKRDYLAAWALTGINAAVHLTAFFTDVCFHITENNHYIGGPLKNCCLYVSMLLLAYLLFLSFRQYRSQPGRELIIPIVVVVLISVSTWMDGQAVKDDQPAEFLTVAVVSSCVLYYIWLHLQFVREHEEDLQARQRIRIMMSQIQPHFLYNTLSTIQALCMTDPEKAADVTGKFSSYLRRNLASLQEPGLIPFWKELEHTKAYAAIEEIRFPNIRVTYEIEDSGFSVPPLTVQPMVENAIRHGVRIRRNGLVEVAARREGDRHVITIRDNGAGFNPETLKDIGDGHIGIRNVRERIESMCGGTLEIESAEGKGTRIMIVIPVSPEEGAP